jgi:hypothetical protein
MKKIIKRSDTISGQTITFTLVKKLKKSDKPSAHEIEMLAETNRLLREAGPLPK